MLTLPVSFATRSQASFERDSVNKAAETLGLGKMNLLPARDDTWLHYHFSSYDFIIPAFTLSIIRIDRRGPPS